MKKVLGISAFYHDSAACLVIGGKIVAAAQEERFSRIKNTEKFPEQAIKYCLDEAKIQIEDLDAVVFYDKPFLTFERLIQTYYSFAPKGLISFLKAMPVWMHEKLFLKKQIWKGLKSIGKFDKSKIELLFTEHHLSHAGSAYYPSPFEESAILTIDGVGEWCTASISHAKGQEITFLREMNFPHSVGLLYSAVTYFLGFKVNRGEYKVMGLAPYGEHSDQTSKLIQKLKDEVVDIKEDGSIWLNQAYFNYSTGLKMTNTSKWEVLLGIKKRKPESEIGQQHCNLALAIQKITEEIVLKMAKEAKRITNSDNLCLAGGVALNCAANGKILENEIFENVFIQPAAGDAGGALGAAMEGSQTYFKEERIIQNPDAMQKAYLGPEFSHGEIEKVAESGEFNYHVCENFEEVYALTAQKIAEGNAIGWFQGRMEFGPRALGNRSILADPRIEDIQEKLNLKIKFRESFRPFAPAVLQEDAGEYFNLTSTSPYMLLTAPVNEKTRIAVNDKGLPIHDKVKLKRSALPGTTHIDYSSRIQTVNEENGHFYHLLRNFKSITGTGVLINTSFNVRSEPIVCTPEDAYNCFKQTGLDYLVMGTFVFDKSNQKEVHHA